VERSHEYWKRNPMLVLGQALNGLPEPQGMGKHFSDCSALFECFTAKELEDHFLLLHFTRQEENEETIHFLQQKGVTRDQIILLHSTPSHSYESSQILVAHDECVEDLRLRISVQIELIRQRRLEKEILAATSNGALRFLHESRESTEVLALDRARYAHALACALQLGPSRHTRSVRLALFYSLPTHDSWQDSLKSTRHLWPIASLLEASSVLLEKDPLEAWPAELALELLVAECAKLAANNADNAIRFRELFREKCAKLPFRLRTDLRDAAERCFTHVWEGDTRAA
jgi:hypothetical protein